MIPLKDNIPSRTSPVINYVVIAICAVVFLAQLQNEQMIEQYGMIPQRLSQPDEPVIIRSRQVVRTAEGLGVRIEKHPAAAPPFHPWWTLLTSMFLHGGWLHIIGNLWFLHIFGDNVEDRFGHVGFALFYLVCGLVAGLVHLATDPTMAIPTVGASGAIAGVMGSYFLLYPRAQVLTLVPIFFFLTVVVVPAVLFLGIWILIQLFQGAFTIASTSAGGVAWWAHIGGFGAGLVITFVLDHAGMLRPKMTEKPIRSGRFQDIRRQEGPWI